MSKFFVPIFLGFTFSRLLGQITIPTTHMPTIGDVFTYGVHGQSYTPKPLVGGVYDFSDLKQDDTAVFRYVANDRMVEFPNSNLKLTEDDNDQATVLFKKDGNDLFLISIAQISSQIPIPNLGSLKGTMKYLSLPISNTTKINTSDELTTTLPKSLFQGFNIDSLAATIVPGATVDSLRLTVKLTLNMYVDGSGKIKTPIDNNIDVLKVVRKITVDPRLALYGKAFGFPINNLDITTFLTGQLPINNLGMNLHTYYSPSFRQEIVNATVDSLGQYSSVNYRYRTKNGVATSQIQTSETSQPELDFSEGKITVKYLLPNQTARLSIYNMEGKKNGEKLVSSLDSSMSIDIISHPFIVQLTDEKGRTLIKKISIE